MKHLIISAKIPLPDDEFEHAEVMLKCKALKDAFAHTLAQIFPINEDTVTDLRHEIISPEPVAPAVTPKARKARTPKPDAFKAKGNAVKAPTAEHEGI